MKRTPIRPSSAHRAWALVVLIAGVAAGDDSALGFKNLHDQSNPFPYYVDSRSSNPDSLALSNVQTEIQTAWNSWNAVQCSSVRAASQGQTSGVVPDPTDAYDNFSVSGVWVTSQNDPVWLTVFDSDDTLAITIPTAYAGVLETCDTYLNATAHPFSVATPTPAAGVDLQTVMVHEAGHCLGLADSGNGVMNGLVSYGVQNRTPIADDTNALCALYPITDAVGSPCDPANPTAGCGNATTLKCTTQTVDGVTSSFCTNGCTLATNSACDSPLTCTASNLFNPSFDGACLRPNHSVTLVGSPCTGNGDCGSSVGQCQLPGLLPSGGDSWVDGYCLQGCLAGEGACPANSTCTDLGGGTLVCLQSCRPGFADCRPNYACATTVTGPVCIPSCAQDVDCVDPTDFLCRSCDGLCVAKQNPTGEIGEACTDDSNCGPGQACVQLDPSSPTKMCTLGCSRGCAACPTGSSCHPLPSGGDLQCLRDCTGPNTCPPGTQCKALQTGNSCMPPCDVDGDCPVGQVCSAGQCVNPGGTGGGGCSGAFCQNQDSGTPITPHPDAGHGGGGVNSGGCGCGSTTAPSLLTVGLLALWAVGRRRRATVSLRR